MASHRSWHAQLRHPAPQFTNSLRRGRPNGWRSVPAVGTAAVPLQEPVECFPIQQRLLRSPTQPPMPQPDHLYPKLRDPKRGPGNSAMPLVGSSFRERVCCCSWMGRYRFGPRFLKAPASGGLLPTCVSPPSAPSGIRPAKGKPQHVETSRAFVPQVTGTHRPFFRIPSFGVKRLVNGLSVL